MAFQTITQLITYSPEIINGEPIYVSTNSSPVKAFKFEPAGHAFHSAALKLNGPCEDRFTSGKDEDARNNKPRAHGSSSESCKSTKKSNEQKDHYTILGLDHLRHLATEEQIKKSYREAALKHHPDKKAALLLAEKNEVEKQKKKDKIEEHFKAIQVAYEVLIDPSRRRIYDSGNDFNDEIPVYCDQHDFFKVFGPAFVRNSRWSVNQPVPSLGDENTLMEEVDSFYDFWYNFKSWREFRHEDEFDIEEAESREHRRWMERQNAKLREGARKEEYARIRALVENAYKRDPRILERKERDKAEKQRKKKAKFLAKKLQEEESARIIEEQRRQKEEEQRKAAEAALLQKKMREKEKKLLRKERSRLRTLSAPVLSHHLLNVSHDDVENLCTSLDIEHLKILCDKFEGKEKLEQAKLLKESLACEDSLDDQNQAKKPKENGSAKGSDSYHEKRNSEQFNGFSFTTRDEIERICPSNGTDHYNAKMDKGQSENYPNSDVKENGFSSSTGQSESLSKSDVKESVIFSSSNQEVWCTIQERALAQAFKKFSKGI